MNAPVDAVCQTCGTGATPVRPPQRARAAVFFDGTGNNRVNSHAARPLASRLPLGGASYGNDPSNVSKGEARMGDYPEVDNTLHSIYVEGIGTQDGGRDIPEGMALGTGITGVPVKMRKGLELLVADLKSLDKSRPIEYVHVDTFGFSRGAAAARHFVHVLLNHPTLNIAKQLTDDGFSVGKVKVTFVGLYDTVSSYGVNHKNDTSQLNMDAIRDADYVFQLAAGEEHRENFSLTDIQSARAGKQIFLPGVHSDIGGGYPVGSETDLEVIDLDWRGIVRWQKDLETLERERQWLIDRGWYTDSELSQPNSSWEIIANRGPIGNTYSHLPLNMMANEARGKGVPFSGLMAVHHALPTDPFIQDIRDQIDRTIGHGNVRKDGSWKNYWLRLNNNQAIRDLRHAYLHTSSVYGSPAHRPNYTSHPSEGGVRMRITHRG